MAEGFGQAIDNARRVMPGLDLAVEVRQLHAQGKNIDAIRAIRTALDCNLLTGVEWLTALTGWNPSRARREAATRPSSELATVLADIGYRLDRAIDRFSNSPQTQSALGCVAREMWTAANEVRNLAH